jgi:phosphohistidine phosphatase
MDRRRCLLVLRHAKTEDSRPGRGDAERRLTPDGERQARDVGDYLRRQGITVDTVLCSSAIRARETLELLKLGDQPAPTSGRGFRSFLQRRTDTLIEAVRELPRGLRCGIAHRTAPGAPGLVYEMTDPDTSPPGAVGAIEGRFPAAALARLEFDGNWSDLEPCSLISVWIPDEGQSEKS